MPDPEDVDELIYRRKMQAEWSFAASAFVAPDIAVEVCCDLNENEFTSHELAAFWKKVKETNDPIRAALDLKLSTDLLKWTNRIPTSLRPGEYVRVMRDCNYYRDIFRGVKDLAKSIASLDNTQVDKALVALHEIHEKSPVEVSYASTSEEAQAEFVKMVSEKDRKVCYSGYSDLDHSALGGFYEKEVTIFAARPGVGKTTFMIQVGINNALAGKRVLFFSMEMSKEQLWAKVACSRAGVSWADVRAGKIDEATTKRLIAEGEAMSKRVVDNFLIVDNVYTLSEMHKAVAHYKPDLVIIDHLGEMHWHDPNEKEVAWYGKAFRYMRQYFAKALNCHVILIHQLNRGVEERQDKRPQMSDLRWSGELEQVADIVMMAYRDDVYNPVPPTISKVQFEVIIRKNRQGWANASTTLMYDLKTQSFTQIVRDVPLYVDRD